LLETIDAAEMRRKAIEQQYSEPGFFEKTSRDDLKSLEREDAELAAKIDEWTKEWEEIENELDKAMETSESSSK
jgi:hypothetical protein